MESRWTWRFLALPGVAWLSLFFLVSVLRGALRRVREPEHAQRAGALLEPARLERRLRPPGPARTSGTARQYLTVFLRTFAYVALALAISLAIGYPIAYFAARHAGRWRGLLLLLLILPFWINYLMKMLAWINLLSPEGWGTRFLHCTVDRPALHQARPADERGRLAGRPVLHARDRARLRLHPLPDPPPVRGARPHRPAPDRGCARPRREPVRRLQTGHPAALDARHSRGNRADRAARCSATTTRTISSRPPRRRA